MTHVLDKPTTIWITGATSGIGYSVSELLIKEGHHLIVTGRRREPLEVLAKNGSGNVSIAPADTTNPDDLASLSAHFEENAPVQMAILSAGRCEYLDVTEFDASIIEKNIHTNVIGTARSVEAVLPSLRAARQRGLPAHLVIVSSSAWWLPFARAEGYGASKAALTYFAQSLRADLAAEGILVTVVSPGFVKTPLTEQNDFPMPFLISVEDAASRIMAGLKKGKTEIQFPKRFTCTLKLLRVLPQGWIDAIAARMARKSTGDNQ